MNWIKSFIIDIKFVSLQRKTKNSKELLFVKGAKHALKNSNDIGLLRMLNIIKILWHPYFSFLLWNNVECPVDIALEQVKYIAKNAVEDTHKTNIREIFTQILGYMKTNSDSTFYNITYKKNKRWFMRFYGTAGVEKGGQ